MAVGMAIAERHLNAEFGTIWSITAPGWSRVMAA